MTILVAALFTLTGTASFAGNSNKCDWQEKMKTEKIAFLTSAMDLTPAEAEKFWPVYNDMENERRASFKKNMVAFKALDEGLKAGLPEKEISVLVKNSEDNRLVGGMTGESLVSRKDKNLSQGKCTHRYISLFPLL